MWFIPTESQRSRRHGAAATLWGQGFAARPVGFSPRGCKPTKGTAVELRQDVRSGVRKRWRQDAMFSHVWLERRMLKNHPLRPIRLRAGEALAQ